MVDRKVTSLVGCQVVMPQKLGDGDTMNSDVQARSLIERID